MRSLWSVSLLLTACAPAASPPPPAPAVPVVDVVAPSPTAEPAPAPAPPEALGLVIDRSGSMSGAPIEATIAACKAAIALLDEDDFVTVIVFDGQADVFVPMQRRGDGTALQARLETLKPGGGTDYRDALTAVGEQLANAAPKARRLALFLSDGRASRQGVVELVAQLHAKGITLSTMSLGDEVDVELLDGMARAGGGRHHRNTPVAELSQAFDVEIRHLMARP